MAQYPMTVRGEKQLRDELHQLKTVERPQVIAAISEARAHGDLKENAEYSSAREQQSFIEGRIQEIEAKLSNAVVIDITKLNQDGRVVFGTTIEIADEDSGETITYHLVGEDEANIKKGLLAYTTPIARGLIGKSEGDSVKIQTPGGVRSFEIMSVKYI